MIAECALLTLALSKHHLNDVKYNEVHPAVGMECKKTPAGHAVVQVFKNSENRTGVYAAKRNHIKGDFYYDVGAATGYKQYAVVPVARLVYSKKNFELFVAPGVETVKTNTGTDNKAIIVTGIQFKVEF